MHWNVNGHDKEKNPNLWYLIREITSHKHLKQCTIAATKIQPLSLFTLLYTYIFSCQLEASLYSPVPYRVERKLNKFISCQTSKRQPRGQQLIQTTMEPFIHLPRRPGVIKGHVVRHRHNQKPFFGQKLNQIAATRYQKHVAKNPPNQTTKTKNGRVFINQ